ncbi:sodium:calcium antiporter [Halomarina rubra]|uniref:Sodium:calcium antiporter n=1 Tax=Halomarina rubra TaxID=2071873 RepID=A0ABD6AW83_9EURY|nr:sodium:calcium antiporter [Halomarina rubra]
MVLGLPPTLVAALLFLGGVFLVVESVETFVESVAEAALGLGVSAFFLTIVLAGTDLENAILGVAAVTGDLPSVALGTVFGEALFILGAAVGLAGVLVPFDVSVPRIYLLVTIASPSLMLAFAADGTLSRLDGALLVFAFVPFILIVYLLERRTQTRFLDAEALEADDDDDEQAVDTEQELEGENDEDEQGDAEATGVIAIAVPFLAVLGMTIGSELAVVGARDLLSVSGISGLAFGATVMSFIASIEELFLTVEPVRNDRPHLGVGNVVGSTVFFVTANAGVIALIRPIDMTGSVLTVHWPFFLGTLAIVVALFAYGRVSRPAGGLLLAAYAAYWGANYVL